MESISFFEPEINREASGYLCDNYEEIVNRAMQLVHRDVARDLVNEVYISLVKSENRGEGYDINHSDNGIILVKQFVLGRLARTAKNSKYRTDLVERKPYKDRDSGEMLVATVVAASCNSEDYEEMSHEQRAYATAESYNGLLEIEQDMDLVQQIRFCCECGKRVNIDVKCLIQNWYNLDLKTIDKSVFEPITRLIKADREFAEALRGVMLYSEKHREEFKSVLASM